jgi:hypothetical protein
MHQTEDAAATEGNMDSKESEVSMVSRQPDIPQEVRTACGGWVVLTPDTPWVIYRDEVVYFACRNVKELQKPTRSTPAWQRGC